MNNCHNHSSFLRPIFVGTIVMIREAHTKPYIPRQTNTDFIPFYLPNSPGKVVNFAHAEFK